MHDADLEKASSASDANAEHFRTDHLLRNLGKHAISSGIVTAAAQGAKFALSLTSAVVLARLLTPEEFGLVGMVLAVTGLLMLLRDAGLSTATVQRETITQEQVSNLFWINVAFGGLLGLIGMGLAPFFAWFYGDSRLVGIMFALSFAFLLTGATVQHQALLNRQMRFKAIAIIEVCSMVGSIVTGCSMALFGYGYWSLVGMQLCMPGMALVMTWWVSGWRPTLPTRNSDVMPLLRFGAHITASHIIAGLAVRSDSILIGRFFGAEALGLYSRANVLMARPMEQLMSPISTVLIPVLSRLQSDPERYRRTFLHAYDTLALIIFPFTALCLVLSEPLVLLLLGPQWEGSVPIFAGFTLVVVSAPLTVTASWLFMSQGRGRDLLRGYSVLSFVTVAAYIAGLPWGPLGVVLALGVASLLIRLPIFYYLVGRSGPVRAADLLKSFLHHLPCWGAVYAATTLVRTLVGESTPPVQLLVCAPVGLAVGGGVAFALKRPRQSALYVLKTLRTSLATWRSGPS